MSPVSEPRACDLLWDHGASVGKLEGGRDGRVPSNRVI